jgi:hypothetical protein
MGAEKFQEGRKGFFKSYEELIDATKVWGMDKPFVTDPFFFHVVWDAAPFHWPAMQLFLVAVHIYTMGWRP